MLQVQAILPHPRRSCFRPCDRQLLDYVLFGCPDLHPDGVALTHVGLVRPGRGQGVAPG